MWRKAFAFASAGLLRAVSIAVSLAISLAACGSSPDPCRNAPRYRTSVQPIVATKCTGCHSRDRLGDQRRGAPPGLDFDSYEAVQPREAALADAITSGREPPAGVAAEDRPTLEERQTVSAWRSCNFPP